MLSRIFWILLAGAAFVGGIAMHERDSWFGWTDDSAVERSAEASFGTRVDRAVDRSFAKVEVIGSNGKAIDVPTATKQELAAAVRRLVAAEADLAFTRVRHESEAAVQEATTRRDAARSDVERLKGEIERREQLSGSDGDFVREQVRQKIRDDINATVRGAIRS